MESKSFTRLLCYLVLRFQNVLSFTDHLKFYISDQGSSVVMRCLSQDFEDFQSCAFIDPQGRIYRNSSLLDDDAVKFRQVRNLQSSRPVTLKDGICSMLIEDPQNHERGLWTCQARLAKSSRDFQTIKYLHKKNERKWRPDFRLPRHLKPLHYTIKIGVKDVRKFSGEVDIDMRAQESGSNVTLHAKRLDVDYDKTMVEINGRQSSIKSFWSSPTIDFFTIVLDDRFRPGDNICVHLVYMGIVSTEGLNGLYARYYKDEDTKRSEVIYMTQLQPIHARKLFPCLDEPDLKARFTVSIGHKEEFEALSNMPKTKAGEVLDDDQDLIWDIFQETPVMSTYLVAIVVSKYDYRPAYSRTHNQRFRIWSKPSDYNETEYAARTAPKIYDYMVDTFGIEDIVPKEDLLAVPAFKFLAMENWGLMLFRHETLVDYNPDIRKFGHSRRSTISGMIAHEFAHIWFGNLVTCRDWSQIWLNEGFANYYGYFAAHHVEAGQRQDELHQKNAVGKAFMQDDNDSKTRPMIQKVEQPEDIVKLFDDITYGKGGALVRMMMDFMGQEVFERAIREYLDEFKFDSAVQDYLFDVLDKYRGQFKYPLPRGLSVKDVMDTWTLQAGYPIVSAEQNEGEIVVRQEGNLRQNDNLWMVPISYKNVDIEDEPVRYFWLTEKIGYISLNEKSIGRNDTFLFNVNAVGYYRVNYDRSGWHQLARFARNNEDSLPNLSKIQTKSDLRFLKGKDFVPEGKINFRGLT